MYTQVCINQQSASSLKGSIAYHPAAHCYTGSWPWRRRSAVQIWPLRCRVTCQTCHSGQLPYAEAQTQQTAPAAEKQQASKYPACKTSHAHKYEYNQMKTITKQDFIEPYVFFLSTLKVIYKLWRKTGLFKIKSWLIENSTCISLSFTPKSRFEINNFPAAPTLPTPPAPPLYLRTPTPPAPPSNRSCCHTSGTCLGWKKN